MLWKKPGRVGKRAAQYSNLDIFLPARLPTICLNQNLPNYRIYRIKPNKTQANFFVFNSVNSQIRQILIQTRFSTTDQGIDRIGVVKIYGHCWYNGLGDYSD